MPSDIVDLNAFVPERVRRAAQEAYRARLRHRSALDDLVAAKRELRDACRAHRINPDDLLVGDTVGTALVPDERGSAYE